MATKSPAPTAATTRTRRPRQPLPPVSPEALRLITMGVGLLRSCVATPALDGEAVARKAHYALAGISLALAEDPALTRGLRRQNRRDKGTIDLILALGHAVPGTLRDWVGGPERHRTSGATPPASAGGPATVPTAAETESAVETDLDLLADFPSTEAREEMYTRLGIAIEKASTRPDCVERARALADKQADDDAYKLGHFLAEILTEIRSGAYQGVGWPTYQAPPRTLEERVQLARPLSKHGEIGGGHSVRGDDITSAAPARRPTKEEQANNVDVINISPRKTVGGTDPDYLTARIARDRPAAGTQPPAATSTETTRERGQ